MSEISVKRHRDIATLEAEAASPRRVIPTTCQSTAFSRVCELWCGMGFMRWICWASNSVRRMNGRDEYCMPPASMEHALE